MAKMNETVVGVICLLAGLAVLFSARRGMGLQKRITSFFFGRTHKDRLIVGAKWIVGAGLAISGVLMLLGKLHLPQ